MYRFQYNTLYTAFVAACQDIPNKNIKYCSMFRENEDKAVDVDYDRIVFDTYDYLDKIIGFKLSDVFYAAFIKYYHATNDLRAEKLAKYIKYGTNDEKEIWMLRYGFSFDDVEWLKKYIVHINQEEVVFHQSVYSLSDDKLFTVQRFLE